MLSRSQEWTNIWDPGHILAETVFRFSFAKLFVWLCCSAISKLHFKTKAVDTKLVLVRAIVSHAVCQDRFDNSGKYSTIHDLVGRALSGAELQKAVDAMYLVARDVSLPFIGSDGEWLHDRDPLNDRGDAATVAERKASWEKNGLYSDIRAGAWVRPRTATLNIQRDTRFYWMHFASLMEGGKAFTG